MDKTQQLSVVIFILFAALVTFIILYISKDKECNISTIKQDFSEVYDKAVHSKNSEFQKFINCEKEDVIKNVGDNELRLATYTGGICEILGAIPGGNRPSVCDKYFNSKDFTLCK